MASGGLLQTLKSGGVVRETEFSLQCSAEVTGMTSP